MRSKYFMILSLMAALCASCTDDTVGSGEGGEGGGQTGETCQGNADCDGERVCLGGKCVLEVALGGDCSAADAVCSEGKCVNGTCKNETEKPGVGEACDMEDAECGNGLICHNGYCGEFLGEGDSCQKDAQCGDGLVCRDGVCSQKISAGGACKNDDECESGGCNDGVCGSMSGSGEPCDATHRCESGLACNADGICADLPGLGENCQESSGCAQGMVCELEICVVKDLADGASCDALHMCASGWSCDPITSKCLQYVSLGGECDATHVCRGEAVCTGGKCVQSRGECKADTDCRTDSYCCTEDACDVKNVCLPYGEGPRGDLNEMCAYKTVPGMFEAAIQCEWKKPAAGDAYPNHANVLTTPLVINTPHDSGTANEIVFVTYNNGDGGAPSGQGTDINYYGVIRIINAETCQLHESLFDDANHIIGGSNPAAADVDGDGFVEIFAGRGSVQKEGAGGGLVAWHWKKADPSAAADSPDAKGHYVTWWKTDTASASTLNWGGPAIHDINDDGVPEIIGFGGEVFNATTGKRMNVGQTIGELYYTPTLGDLDADGKVEIIGTSNVYRWNTEKNAWEVAYATAHSSVGIHPAYADFGTPKEDGTFDFDHLDGIAEIVSCGSNIVDISTLQGKRLLHETPSGDKGGGPCTIGDFDGDGLPEVATAFGYYYRIFDPRCKAGDPGCMRANVLWEKISQDLSSASTGSSLFDFDGDGAMEAVYADECYTRVYDGKTGDVLFSAYRSSATWHEYPVIADVDNDESAEIVVGSNNRMSCATPDPIHRGLRCEKDDDCKSGKCVKVKAEDTLGLCRCTSNDQCNYRTDSEGNVLNEYECVAGLTAEDQAGGNVCRARRSSSETVTGVRVMRDSLDRWMSSRNIWNQHAYNITNILDDMKVPKTSSWIQNFKQMSPKLNNFRQNVQGNSGPNLAPDITGRFTGNSCSVSGGKVSLGAEICNRGTKMVASLMPATFYLVNDDDTRKQLCVSYTTANVPVGGCLRVTCDIDDTSAVMGKKIVMVANDDGKGGRTTVECNDDNNEDYTTISDCPVY